MNWLENIWYQAGWSHEIETEGMLSRTYLNIPVVLFRNKAGVLSALKDMCPHRFAPLSKGRVENDRITCGYHGLSFNGGGQCIHNPHGRISQGMRVDSYRVEEKHSAIWIWLGDQELSDVNLIPDLSYIDEAPEKGRIYGNLPTKANYQLGIDNILDLSHVDFLHPTTLGGMMSHAKFSCVEEKDGFLLEWDIVDGPVGGAFKPNVPEGNADTNFKVKWIAPGVMTLETAIAPHGDKQAKKDLGVTLHNMVPENAVSTHYFYCAIVPNPAQFNDSEFMNFLTGALETAFIDEDKPMLEAQQARIQDQDFWEMKPRLLPVDEGAVKVRRKLDAMIKAEREIHSA